ncbi:MAG: hypothetical protein JWN95_1345 [Frankiales bacterium]|nr:hypothetical protein [Frankiales bacterium]
MSEPPDEPTPVPVPEPADDPDPDPAWKALGLVNDWLQHAETKGAGALASSGVIGGVLFNVIKDKPHVNVWAGIAGAVTVVLVIAGALFAAASLWPRLRQQDEPTSPLYFNHIARAHPDPTTYHETLRLLTADKSQIIRELAVQVWANAHVAHKKYKWAALAIASVVGALMALGVTVILLEAQTRGWIHG